MDTESTRHGPTPTDPTTPATGGKAGAGKLGHTVYRGSSSTNAVAIEASSIDGPDSTPTAPTRDEP